MRRFVVALPLMVIALIASLVVAGANSSAIPPAAQQSPEHVATLAATSTGQDFGYSVAVSGSTIVVGADWYNGFQGRVYVFTDNGDGTVTQQAVLTASDAAASDLFGIAVAVDADTIVVGAVGKSTYRGAAYVFTKPGGGWSDATQTAKLTYASPANYDRFGYSVDVSGDTIVVGARDTDISASSSGSAQVFTKPGGGWVSTSTSATLTASDAAALDHLGAAVSVSGDTVVAGAPDAANGGTSRGSAYVFVKPGGGWADAQQTAILSASGVQNSTEFATTLDIAGDTVIVGAPRANGGGSARGVAYVYTKPGGGWVNGTETAALTASNGGDFDNFGFAVSASADEIAVGAPDTDAGGFSKGTGYFFAKPATGWASGTETAMFAASSGVNGDKFGTSIGISGRRIVAGAPYTSAGGNAYLFRTIPAFSVVPTSVDFGIVDVSTTSSQTITVTNAGTSPLTVSGVALSGTNSGQFSIANNTCVTTLAIAATCTLDVVFAPTAAAAASASVVFTDDAAGSPHSVALTGVGATPSPSPSPSPTPTPTPTPSVPQEPTKPLNLPKTIEPGTTTVLVRLPIVMDSGQRATATAECLRSRASSSLLNSGDVTPTCRTIRTPKALKVVTSGERRERVRLTITAPATVEYEAYRLVKTYRVPAL